MILMPKGDNRDASTCWSCGTVVVAHSTQVMSRTFTPSSFLFSCLLSTDPNRGKNEKLFYIVTT